MRHIVVNCIFKSSPTIKYININNFFKLQLYKQLIRDMDQVYQENQLFS